jgi:hypothetical protein
MRRRPVPSRCTTPRSLGRSRNIGGRELVGVQQAPAIQPPREALAVAAVVSRSLQALGIALGDTGITAVG